MAEMQISEALNVIQQVKNRYQAFAKLEEVLQFTVATINNSKEIQQRLKSLQSDETNARAQLEVLQNEIAELNSQRVTITKANEQRVQELSREASERHEKANREHSERMTSLDRQYEETREKLQKEVSDLQEELRETHAQLADAIRSLETTKSQHETVKKELRSKLGLE